MKYSRLGKSGMKVSKLALGTMNFGPLTSDEESFAIMDKALDAGINFFDTANVYGWGVHRGYTEEIIGRWFAKGGNRREKVVLATKVYNDMEDETDGPNREGNVSAYKIRRHVEGSLKRLQTDHIELYQMHHIDRNVTWSENWGAFEALVNQGKIYYVGSSNFAGWDIAKAQAAADKRNFIGLISEQHKYNLLCRLPELEVLPASMDFGLGVIPWSPLAGGLLGGNIFEAKEGSRGAQLLGNLSEKEKEQLKRFSKLASEMGESESNIALAWLLANPAVTAPIIGPRTVKQLEDALRSVEISLSADFLAELDKIFPGPGGDAPRAYAW
ncbi:MAG: aldo/keto reductase [Saccharofermentanales bacterium]